MVRLAPALVCLLAEVGCHASGSTCGDFKDIYQAGSCCAGPENKSIGHAFLPDPAGRLDLGNNPCANAKVDLPNINCTAAWEQAGADVTGNNGTFNVSNREPILSGYIFTNLCPVNVHWHLGAEHRMAGEFDETGTSKSSNQSTTKDVRRLGEEEYGFGEQRYGFACRLYDPSNPTHTTEYDWKHCQNMNVGETYEIHWPHSALGDCGGAFQYQTPFYDGVFCNWNTLNLSLNLTAPYNVDRVINAQELAKSVGVQSQVFFVVNDENYYYPDLMRGAIKNADKYWYDVAKYTGSTTGTSRNDDDCSQYSPITWQVDRKCHMISASSFDKMCFDMKQQADDMSGDLHPHGARELADDNMKANNQRMR